MERILLVDDSAAMRAYLRAALEAAGLTDVVEAESGLAALRLLSRGGFTVAVVDINTPDISGLELLAFIRRNATYRAVPVIVVTTEGREVDRNKALALGADAFLVKPVAPEALVAAVRACNASEAMR